MHLLPSPSIALDSLERDGDLALQHVQEQEDPITSEQGLTEKHQEPAVKKKDEMVGAAQLSIKKPEQKPQQSIFLCCGGKGREEYAVQIPCYRSKSRPHFERFADKHGVDRHGLVSVKPTTFDDDVTIYKKLSAACYQHHGGWKNWIPFYGVVDAHEVNFHILGTTDKAFEFRVQISQLDWNAIRTQFEERIAKLEALRPAPDCDFDWWCHDDWHTDICNNSPEFHDECIEDKIKRYQRCIHKMKRRYFMTECAQYPARARNLKTLDGMTQQSPILENSELKNLNDEDLDDSINALPGIEIVLGWQTDRIAIELPFNVSLIGVLVSIIWIGVVSSGFSRDWDISYAFGSFAIATLTLIFMAVKR